ncbi:type II toxin-antitoxin system RelE/ParE family toxin [Candidatus Uhrbacteria bacterium]|nr:type II toxin-antitoxin system RelE/ParE family toxin [Candidatus Uhrbacteria bacterium]
MPYLVILPKKVQKDLNAIDSRYVDRIFAALEGLLYDPFLGKRLKGEYRNYYSYRVWPYRIMYSSEKEKLFILIIRIGHWQRVY